MGQIGWHNVWDGIVETPFPTRIQKPRDYGLTMVMDKGTGLQETSEMLSMAGKYVDFIKLAFGTSALYNGDILKKKIDLVRSHEVHIYPGGTFLEIAIMQNKVREFLNRAWELGFSAIEVSDGTITMSPETRRATITTASEMGFTVLSEVGKKDPAENPSPASIAQQIIADLEAGAGKVIMEARESGMGIGIFNEEGEIKKDCFSCILGSIPDPACIIWEAPIKKQQQDLILHFGPNVNLGNIPPSEVIALESLRVGLRGDTLKTIIKKAAGCKP